MDEMKLRKYIGDKIREFRINKKLSQKELGEKLGVSHNTVSDYENGKILLGQDKLFALADVLDVSIDDFFPARNTDKKIEEIIANEDFDASDIEFLRQLIEKVKSLSNEDRERLIDDIRIAVEFFEKRKQA